MGSHSISSTHRSEGSLRAVSYRERHEKKCPYTMYQTNKYKNRATLETKSEPSLKQFNSISNKKRVATRRNQAIQKQTTGVILYSKENDNLEEINSGQQKFSKGDLESNGNHIDLVDKSNICQLENVKMKINEEQEQMKNKKILEPRTDQHAYLQFLLKITEDIILNNYFKNEDIINVFEYHIEANKDILNLDKMKEHIQRLSEELNIAYESDNNEKLIVGDIMKEKYLDMNISPNILQELQFDSNCECSVKRILNLKGVDFGNFVNILENKRSLDKLTECTEPTNSTDTVCISPKTTISSIENIHQLTTDVGKETASEFCIKTNYIPNGLKEIKSAGDIPLNRSEIVDCAFLDKFIVNIQDDTILLSDNYQTSISNPNIKKEDVNIDSEVKLDDSEQLNESVVQSSKSSIDNLQNNKHVNEDISTTKEQSTQIVINYSDKECSTKDDIINDDIAENDDYVLVNGPVYILKKIFEVDKMVILTKPSQIEVDYAPVKETSQTTTTDNFDNSDGNTSFTNSTTNNPVTAISKISREKTFVKEAFHTCNINDYSINPELSFNPLYLNENNFYRLLHSDYDITPHRDHNIDKYHYLLVDASTSASSVKIDNAAEEQNLLKSDCYAIGNGQNHIEEYLKFQ